MRSANHTSNDALTPDLASDKMSAEFEQGAPTADQDPDAIDDANSTEGDALSPEEEAQLARRITVIKTLHHKRVREGLEIGWELIQIREVEKLVPHGQFMLWFRRTFTFSLKTAERWINAAKAFKGKFDT